MAKYTRVQHVNQYCNVTHVLSCGEFRVSRLRCGGGMVLPDLTHDVIHGSDTVIQLVFTSSNLFNSINTSQVAGEKRPISAFKRS
jgi:hypothetical protein